MEWPVSASVGIGDERLQRRLLCEKDLTFTKAFELCQIHESAESNAKLLNKPDQIHVTRTDQSCYHCGGNHLASNCRFKEMQCNFCKKKGHMARVCRRRIAQQQPSHQDSRRRSPSNHSRPTNCLEHDVDDNLKAAAHIDTHNQVTSPIDVISVDYPTFQVAADRVAPYYAAVVANGKHLRMEIDTGAALSLISEATYRRLWPTNTPELTSTPIRLRTYTGEGLNVKGSIEVKVEHNGQKENLHLLVVQGNGPSLMGRDWLLRIKLDWSKLHSVKESSPPEPRTLDAVL